MPIISKDEAEKLYEDVCVARPDLCELLSELGVNIYSVFDTESIYKVFRMLEEAGLKESAERALKLFYASEEYWATKLFEQTGRVAMFDPNAMRWRDMLTGRWVADPYKYLWI